MKRNLLFLCFLAMVACENQTTVTNENDVITVLDAWHKAAADADFEAYFGYFENERSVFMGTDATERWTVSEFKPWSKPFFERGRAWSFSGHHRFVTFSEDGKTAWFDEQLDTPNLGPCRGTGVLVLKESGWKIAHYNLTVPIPNEIVDEVVKMIGNTEQAAGD